MLWKYTALVGEHLNIWCNKRPLLVWHLVSVSLKQGNRVLLFLCLPDSNKKWSSLKRSPLIFYLTDTPHETFFFLSWSYCEVTLGWTDHIKPIRPPSPWPQLCLLSATVWDSQDLDTGDPGRNNTHTETHTHMVWMDGWLEARTERADRSVQL